MLTARASQEAKIEGLESGADEYLTKPFHLYELELRIQNLLREQLNVRNHLQEKLLSSDLIAASSDVSDIFLNRLQEYLESNLSNSKLKAETVAEAMAMSKSTLNRKLKVLLNISINDYVKQFRLQRAMVLLSAGNNVTEVLYQVGFETATYFTQCFKEYYRKTPSEFIRAFN